MDVIELKELAYDDICLLLSAIYPNTILPEDDSIEILLEIGQRFLMSGVVQHAEHHLIHNSKFDIGRIIYIAEKFGMHEATGGSLNSAVVLNTGWVDCIMQRRVKLQDFATQIILPS
uniref:BTB domain-containing protein n=1 Tax=Caenorhabditis tropicalis TaxID=1561998 RepID=A0A1I7V3X6_9PELO